MKLWQSHNIANQVVIFGVISNSIFEFIEILYWYFFVSRREHLEFIMVEFLKIFYRFFKKWTVLYASTFQPVTKEHYNNLYSQKRCIAITCCQLSPRSAININFTNYILCFKNINHTIITVSACLILNVIGHIIFSY